MALPLSRYTVSLQTDQTRPDEFYHQICALSERTINKNFVKLFQQRGNDIAELKFFNGNIMDGMLSAILDPPAVSLQLQNVDNPQLLFRIRFKSGFLVVGKGERNKVNLEGWEIAVSAYMDGLVANPTGDIPDKAKNVATRAMVELEKTYDFLAPATAEEQRPDPARPLPAPRKMKPGEYSIHRLFAAISENAWSAPIPKESSLPGPNGTRITLEEWVTDPENSDRASSVMSVLRSWASKHQHSALFTLGLSVKLPESEDNRTATFTPIALRLQNYPYFTDDEIMRYRQPSKFPVGTDGNEYNCFVYCEATNCPGAKVPDAKVPGAKVTGLPSIRRLPFTGNLAEPHGPKGEAMPKGEIDGSFVVSHQLYLEGHLLKLLRDLSRAVQVIPLKPKFGYTSDFGDIFSPCFAFGCDPDNAEDKNRLPNPWANRGDANDKFFDWKRSQTNGYEWSDYIDAWGSNKECYDYTRYKMGPFYRRWSINSKMSVKISWVEGTSDLLVSGRTEYFHWEGYNRSTSDFRCGESGGTLWGEFKTVATWSLIIMLAVPKDLQNDPTKMNGVIEPRLGGLNRDFLPKDFTVEKESYMKNVLDDTHKFVAKAIQEKMSDALKGITANIVGKFAGVGRFYYPGSQELIFGDPYLTKEGDIIATISYNDELPPGRVAVRPTGAMKYEEPMPMTPTVVIADPIRMIQDDKLLPLLTWSGQVDSYNPLNQPNGRSKAKITLRAHNNTGKSIAFHLIKIQMLLSKTEESKLRQLYSDDNPDHWVEWVDPKTIKAEWEKRVEERRAKREEVRKKAEVEAAVKKKGAQATTNLESGAKQKSENSTEEDGDRSTTPATTASTRAPASDFPAVDEAGVATIKTSNSTIGEIGLVPSEVGQQTSTNLRLLDDEPDPEPVPPMPQATYRLTTHGLNSKAGLRKRSEAGEIVFEVKPQDSDGKVDDEGKIIFGPSAKIVIELEGEVFMFGKYVLQMLEIWADPTDNDSDLYEDKFIPGWMCVELDPMGGGEVRTVPEAEAEKIQGIVD